MNEARYLSVTFVSLMVACSGGRFGLLSYSFTFHLFFEKSLLWLLF